jgi:hypothetical protein
MKRITDLIILQEFTNESIIFGLYWCKFKDSYKLFTRNGETFKVLSHFFDHDELNEINSDVKNELLQEIKNQNKLIEK